MKSRLRNSPETPSNDSESFFHRRRKALIFIASATIIAATGVFYKVGFANHGGKAVEPTRQVQTEKTNKFLSQIGQSLVDHHEDSHGGWRFKSAIQAPHYQTDRDVGAASVGEGFLVLSKIDDAKKTANWLMAVSSQDGEGGRYWPDYVDDHETSSDFYTSFDDGMIGIGDFFWQLYEKTNDPQYTKIYIETINWTLSQAEPYQKDRLRGYRWKWDVSDTNSPYYMGMGEGAAGITYALADCYQRLQHSDTNLAGRCKDYVNGSLNYIESVRQELARNIGSSMAIPETGVIGSDGGTELDSGYLSGVAGDAFMYMHLYKVFDNKEYLNQATGLLDYLSDDQHGSLVKVGDNSVTWKLALDPQAGDNNHYATGFEEGNAGIGWVFLQAYRLSGNKAYLRTADQAGNWLIDVAVNGSDGSLSWHEDEHPVNPLIHANLNNGAAGIVQFLWDLGVANGNNKYKDAARRGLKGLMISAKFKGSNIYWQDNGGDDPYSNDPSWHWGLAGIAGTAQRVNGGHRDIPGEQPALMP
jgi:hypothetical protein